MRELGDILVFDVRGDGRFHGVKAFVRPSSPTVRRIAYILSFADDPIKSAWEWVSRVVEYQLEQGEFWSYPEEAIAAGVGDCDDAAILLCSVLRNYLGPDEVFVVVGTHNSEGHAWVTVDGNILESTRAPNGVPRFRYHPVFMFNDKKVYSMNSWPEMIPVGKKIFVC